MEKWIYSGEKAEAKALSRREIKSVLSKFDKELAKNNAAAGRNVQPTVNRQTNVKSIYIGGAKGVELTEKQFKGIFDQITNRGLDSHYVDELGIEDKAQKTQVSNIVKQLIQECRNKFSSGIFNNRLFEKVFSDGLGIDEIAKKLVSLANSTEAADLLLGQLTPKTTIKAGVISATSRQRIDDYNRNMELPAEEYVGNLIKTNNSFKTAASNVTQDKSCRFASELLFNEDTSQVDHLGFNNGYRIFNILTKDTKTFQELCANVAERHPEGKMSRTRDNIAQHAVIARLNELSPQLGTAFEKLIFDINTKCFGKQPSNNLSTFKTQCLANLNNILSTIVGSKIEKSIDTAVRQYLGDEVVDEKNTKQLNDEEKYIAQTMKNTGHSKLMVKLGTALGIYDRNTILPNFLTLASAMSSNLSSLESTQGLRRMMAAGFRFSAVEAGSAKKFDEKQILMEMGPTTIKLLQAFSDEDKNKSLKSTFNSVRGGLSRLDPEMVKAQFVNYLTTILDANQLGNISNIELQTSLGAASIAESITANITYKDNTSTEIVTKMIRSNVQSKFDDENKNLLTTLQRNKKLNEIYRNNLINTKDTGKLIRDKLSKNAQLLFDLHNDKITDEDCVYLSTFKDRYACEDEDNRLEEQSNVAQTKSPIDNKLINDISKKRLLLSVYKEFAANITPPVNKDLSIAKLKQELSKNKLPPLTSKEVFYLQSFDSLESCNSELDTINTTINELASMKSSVPQEFNFKKELRSALKSYIAISSNGNPQIRSMDLVLKSPDMQQKFDDDIQNLRNKMANKPNTDYDNEIDNIVKKYLMDATDSCFVSKKAPEQTVDKLIMRVDKKLNEFKESIKQRKFSEVTKDLGKFLGKKVNDENNIQNINNNIQEENNSDPLYNSLLENNKLLLGLGQISFQNLIKGNPPMFHLDMHGSNIMTGKIKLQSGPFSGIEKDVITLIDHGKEFNITKNEQKLYIDILKTFNAAVKDMGDEWQKSLHKIYIGFLKSELEKTNNDPHLQNIIQNTLQKYDTTDDKGLNEFTKLVDVESLRYADTGFNFMQEFLSTFKDFGVFIPTTLTDFVNSLVKLNTAQIKTHTMITELNELYISLNNKEKIDTLLNELDKEINAFKGKSTKPQWIAAFNDFSSRLDNNLKKKIDLLKNGDWISKNNIYYVKNELLIGISELRIYQASDSQVKWDVETVDIMEKKINDLFNSIDQVPEGQLVNEQHYTDNTNDVLRRYGLNIGDKTCIILGDVLDTMVSNLDEIDNENNQPNEMYINGNDDSIFNVGEYQKNQGMFLSENV